MASEQTTQQRLNKSCVLLIAIAGIERFAFKGVASNLVTYLTNVMKLTNSSAAKMVNIWCGLTLIMPLLVAPIADAYYHKYSTITTSSFLYLLGLTALTSTAVVMSRPEGNEKIASSFLSSSLCLISVGQGGYNPSLQAFGADQLDDDDDDDDEENKSNKKTVFFQGWYFGVCGGSLLGVIVMSYIQDTFGWVLGFAIPAMSMAASMLVFSCGSPIYVYNRGGESKTKKPLDDMVQSIKAYSLKCFRSRITLPKEDSSEEVKEIEIQGRPLCCENMENLREWNENNNGKSSTVMVASFKVVLRLIPIWTMLLMFAVIFQQPPTFFTKQGMTMKRNIGKNLKIPPATLQSAITLSIILLMPLYDRIFIPMAQLITRQDKGISVTQRMGIGMALSVVAMVIAALVEGKRLETGRETREAGLKSGTVNLSIFWLIPQYVLLGISDIFTVVGMQEFFYGEVPKNMRMVGIALYTSVFGVGSFVSALLISVVESVTGSQGKASWFSDDINEEARLDNYYWLLATLSAISLFLYAFLCKYYYKKGDSSNEF